MKRRLKRMATLVILGIALLFVVVVAGCVHFSGGTWMVKEAALPEGWPQLTGVGDVQVKRYPVYRAAIVDDSQVAGGTGPMFNTLFSHIKRNDIAMTTPVEMGYERRVGPTPSMASMAFIYREPDWGTIGVDGNVLVRDVASETMASIGVRGNYTDQRMRDNLAMLDAWLADRTDRYRVTGPPRYLGYNGPFTPPFMRYGEVQVPVEELGSDTEPPAPDAD